MKRAILAALIAASLSIQPASSFSVRKIATAPIRYTWNATKATARLVVKVNDDPRMQATVRVISTVTTVAGAAFFVKGVLF